MVQGPQDTGQGFGTMDIVHMTIWRLKAMGTERLMRGESLVASHCHCLWVSVVRAMLIRVLDLSSETDLREALQQAPPSLSKLVTAWSL